MSETTAGQLRDSFDGTFARPREGARGELIDLLGIVLGGDPHGIRLSSIAGVHADRAVTPLPSSTRALLGVAGFRGTLVPVFDLGTLVGYPPATEPRWLCRIERGGDAACFAFEALLGHFRAESSAFAERAAGHDREVVQIDSRIWPVIDVDAVWQLVSKQKE